ncbi:hypothetical protein IKF76_00200, partial [Candidatus Saccharibacteria bacterium]|nr:hypothetical protein [Candidatus Saccharibacteria bacterium]
DVPMMQKAIKKIKEKHQVKAKVVACHKSELKKYEVYPDHSEFTLGATKFHFGQPMPRDLAIQLSMLKKLASYLKIKLKTDLTALPMPPGRNSYFVGKKGLNLIDSSYNAHLISFQSILDMAKAMKTEHKWLVIGDMVEQGSIEGEEHTKLADAIAKVKPEQVILVGRRTQKYTAKRLEELGIMPYSTLEPRNALKYIEQNTTGGETIFFKGSQYLEWIIEKLLLNPNDADRLPRREKAAAKRRAKRGLDS